MPKTLEVDRYLLAGALLLLSFEVSFLLAGLDAAPDRRNLGGVSQRQLLGEIVQTSRQVRRRAQESLVWSDSRASEELFEQDSVLTLAESSAKLRLDGGTQLQLDENSLIVLERKQRAPADGSLRIRFSRGGLRAHSASQAVNLQSETFVLAAEKGSSLNLKQMEGGHFAVEMISGHARLESIQHAGETPTNLEAGEKLLLDDGKPVEKKVLSKQFTWNADLPERIYTRAVSAKVQLNWQGEADALQIVRPGKRPEVLSLKPNQREAVELDLAPGTYSLSLLRGSEESLSWQVQIVPATPSRYFAPLPRDRVPLGSTVQFAWEKIPEAVSYQWQLSDSREFRTVLETAESEEPRLQLAPKAEGEFYWRVQGKDPSGAVIPAPRIYSLRVLAHPLNSPELRAPTIQPSTEPAESPDEPEIRAPANKGARIFWRLFLPTAHASEKRKPSSLTGGTAVFSWGVVPGAASYVVEISETPGFEEPLVAEEVRAPNFVWRNFKPGLYFWRVAAESATQHGLFSSPAAVNLMNLESPGPGVRIKPVVKSVPIAASEPVSAAPAPTPTPTPPESRARVGEEPVQAFTQAGARSPASWGRLAYRPFYRSENFVNPAEGLQAHLAGFSPVSLSGEIGSKTADGSQWGLRLDFAQTKWRPTSGFAVNELTETQVRVDLFTRLSPRWAVGGGTERLSFLSRASDTDVTLSEHWIFGPMLIYTHPLTASGEFESELRLRFGNPIAGASATFSYRQGLFDRENDSVFFAAPFVRAGYFALPQKTQSDAQFGVELGLAW